MKAIRLFGRSTITWKEKDITSQEHLKFVEELKEKHIQHNIQMHKLNIQKTNRKLKPYTCEFSYWSWQTIQQMVDEFLGEKE